MCTRVLPLSYGIYQTIQSNKPVLGKRPFKIEFPTYPIYHHYTYVMYVHNIRTYTYVHTYTYIHTHTYTYIHIRTPPYHTYHHNVYIVLQMTIIYITNHNKTEDTMTTVNSLSKNIICRCTYMENMFLKMNSNTQ